MVSNPGISGKSLSFLGANATQSPPGNSPLISINLPRYRSDTDQNQRSMVSYKL